MLCVFDEFELLQVRQRTRDAMQHLKKNGKRVSRHPPFGFRFDDGGLLTPDDGEREAIKMAKHLAGLGESTNGIRWIFQEKHTNPRTNKPYSVKAVRAMLKVDTMGW